MEELATFIQEVFKTKDFIPLHEPQFRGNEKKYLNECIDSTFVSSVGPFVERFEREFASFVGSKYAVATTNGTAALHLALVVAGVGEEDEVITQALSFVATPNAISYTGAKPVFIDVDRDTLGLSPLSLELFLEKNCQIDNNKCINKTTNKVIKACVPMHTFGHPCKIDELTQICKKWHIILIEDAAESLGSYYKKQHTGTFGKMGVFSFNGNKIITAGGGGVLVTDDASLAKRAKHLSTTAKVPHSYEFIHDNIAYNYRMPNLNAALLVAQMEVLEDYLQSKKELAGIYANYFKTQEAEFVNEPKSAQSNYWLNAIILKDKKERDSYLEYLNSKGVMSRPVWQLLSELVMYKKCQHDGLKNSLNLSQRVINLPSSVRNKT